MIAMRAFNITVGTRNRNTKSRAKATAGVGDCPTVSMSNAPNDMSTTARFDELHVENSDPTSHS